MIRRCTTCSGTGAAGPFNYPCPDCQPTLHRQTTYRLELKEAECIAFAGDLSTDLVHGRYVP